jgi:hypothetical protein
MAGKLSPTGQQRLALLEGFTQPVGRLNSLVEQYAVAKVGHENLNSSIRRTSQQLKMKMMGVGLDSMAAICGTIELTCARGGQPGQKARTLREHIGSLKFQIELAMRTVVREDMEMQASKAKTKTAASGTEE